MSGLIETHGSVYAQAKYDVHVGNSSICAENPVKVKAREATGSAAYSGTEADRRRAATQRLAGLASKDPLYGHSENSTENRRMK